MYLCCTITPMAATAKKSAQPKYQGKIVALLWLAALSPFIGLGALVLIASQSNLPDTEALANPKTNLATEVFTSDEVVIGRYYRENRSDVNYTNLPAHLIDALVSTEDERYWSHSGIDFIGLARAAVYLGKKGGGSTITQQLAKLLFTEEYERTTFLERAFLQKPKEWIIATRLEKQYTKEEIITLYLNRYDFINQAVGIKSAAYIYFNKPVDSLKVEESAMLVGMLKNASLYNPMRWPEKVEKRREVVLSQMRKNGKISNTEYDSLRVLPLGLNFQRVSHDEGYAPYFREVLRLRLRDILNEKNDDGSYVRAKADGTPYDLYGDGLKVYTTIDSRLQAYAETAVKTHLSKELQNDFWKDLKKRKKENAPFYNGIDKNDRERILRQAVKGSERYKKYSGDQCPNCERPAYYIGTLKRDGKTYFHCEADKGGCDHEWQKFNEDEIEVAFNTATNMRVFSHAGPIDTVMSPMDSIIYHKSFLHASLMSVEPSTGHIKAWVGGIDYKFFQYDNVYQSRRQVGSTFKPFVYASAIRQQMHPCVELPNQKVVIEMPAPQPPWSPDNSDFKYGEMVTMKYALANSMNTITAKIIKDYGTDIVVQTAHAMGIESEVPSVPSIALGVAELSLYEITAANATFVNHGYYIEPTFIVRIEDKRGNVIYEPELNIRQGIDEVSAHTTLMMLKGVMDGAYNRELGKSTGTGMRLRMDLPSRDYDGIKVPMAGKTGTTQSNTDGWFIGLTPDLVTGVWVGAQDPAVRFSTTDKGQGANTALPIYGYYMKAAYADTKLKISTGDFEAPAGFDPSSVNCTEYNGNNTPIFDPDFGEGGDEDLFK